MHSIFMKQIQLCSLSMRQTIQVYGNDVSYLNLSLHGNTEEGDEIHDKNGPKDGNVEAIKECADYCNHC
jgi:hypothetical protein